MEQSRASTLTSKAYDILVRKFKERNHNPSEGQMEGLYRIINVMARMSTGECEEGYHLSDLAPGIGKTTAIICFLKAYLESPDDGTGCILAVDRLEQISSFIKEANLPNDSFAVLVSEPADKQFMAQNKGSSSLNASGLRVVNINKARILFTTKQQIRAKACSASYKSFSKAHSLFYKDKPRAIRVWDETLVCGRAFTMNESDLLKIAGMISDKNKTSNAVATLLALRETIKSLEDNTRYQMPETENIAIELNSYKIKGSKEYIDTLTYLSRSIVTVRNDNFGATFLDCVDELPDDFSETGCLVTDASGSLRATYDNQKKYRGDLIHLNDGLDSGKTYKKLTVYHHKTSSGKNAYSQNATEVTSEGTFAPTRKDSFVLHEAIAECAEVIQSRPEERFLLICHKERLEIVQTKLRSSLCHNYDRVSFLTMGKHTATNEYQDIPNCIIMGMTYMTDAQYEALGRASGTFRSKDGVFPKSMIRRIKEQEFKHNLLQAATRSRIRSAEEGGCKESRLWLRASIRGEGRGAMHNGPKIILQNEVFPGCILKPWHEDAKRKNKTYIDKVLIVLDRFRDEDRIEFSQKELQKEVEHPSSRAFRQKVLRPIEDEFHSRNYQLIRRGRENWYTRSELPAATAA